MKLGDSSKQKEHGGQRKAILIFPLIGQDVTRWPIFVPIAAIVGSLAAARGF
jgi:hypothetical protein